MTCPVCGSESRQVGMKNSYPVARCPACGHLFTARMPSAAELADYYSRYSYDAFDLQHVPKFVFGRLKEVAARFEAHRRGGRLLDVGFGAGAMLQVARDLGWEVYGLEMSALAVKQAKENGFENAALGDFLESPYPAGFFDVIVAVELLEHLRDPLSFLRQAARLLAPEGLFYATTPNGGGLSCRALGLDWSAVAPQEHLHLFSEPSIRRALRAQGFEEVEVSCEGINPYELFHHFRSKLPLRALVERQAAFNRVESSYALNYKLTESRKGAAIKATGNWILRQAGWGDTLKVSAVKSANAPREKTT